MLLSGDISARLGPDITIVDDFESYTDSADFRSQWSSNDPTMDWGIGTSGPGLYEGSQYLECTDPGGGGDNALTVPADGVLNYYPQRGDVLELYVTPTGDNLTDKNILYFYFGAEVGAGYMNGVNNGYYVTIDWDDDEFRLGETTTETESPTTDDEFTVSLDTTYRVEIDFDSASNGDIIADVYEATGSTVLATRTLNDTSHNYRGVCIRGEFDGGTPAACHVDYIVKTNA